MSGRTTIPSVGVLQLHGRKEGDLFHLEVTIPPNTTARIYLPEPKHKGGVKIGFEPPVERSDVKPMPAENGFAVIDVKAGGSYSFETN